MSRIRETSVFGGLPIASRRAELRKRILDDLRERGKRDAAVTLIQNKQRIRLLEKLEESLNKEVKTVKNEKDEVNLKQADLISERRARAVARPRR